MLANINIDVNALLKELNVQTKSAKNWKSLACIGVFLLGVNLSENKKLKEKNKSLAKEIEVLKTAKGE